MKAFIGRFLGDQSGATVIEYALIASLIAVVITAAVGFVGQSLLGAFQQVQGAFPAP